MKAARGSGAVETGIAALAVDRINGSGYLARKALGILTLAEPRDREPVALRLATLRPEMPAIAAAVKEAVESGDIRAVVRRGDAERRRSHRRPQAPAASGALIESIRLLQTP